MAVTREEMIEAIKGMTVLELSELVKALEQELGVTAMAMAPSAGPAVAVVEAPPEEEQTEFDVILQSFGERKVHVIKAVRGLTTLSLRDAKELVESAPVTVKGALSKAEAEAAKAELEEVGATAEIR